MWLSLEQRNILINDTLGSEFVGQNTSHKQKKILKFSTEEHIRSFKGNVLYVLMISKIFNTIRETYGRPLYVIHIAWRNSSHEGPLI